MGEGMKRAFAAAKATRRTPRQQADEFVAGNDKSLVVSGYALEPDPNKTAKGARYQLENGRGFTLGREACGLLPKGYPKWKI